MKYTNDQLAQIQKCLNEASTPEEMISIAKDLGYEFSNEEATAFFTRIQASDKPEGKIDEEQLTDVNGGFGTDIIPQYEEIKDFYKEKGANLAFTLCIYYIPSPICHQIVEHIESEVKQGK